MSATGVLAKTDDGAWGELSTNRLASCESPRVAKWLVMSSAKGGSGKTTTARNLGVFAAHAGLSVGTIDLDIQGTLTNWYTRRPEQAPGIQHFCVPIGDLQAAIETIGNRNHFDLIIVDTPPGVEATPTGTRVLLRKADFVLVPTGQGGPDIDSVIEWMSFIHREGRKAAFVLNRTKRNAGSFERAKLRLIEIGSLCPVDIRDLEDIQATHDNGLGVLEVRGANGVQDLRGVWAFVRNEMGLGK